MKKYFNFLILSLIPGGIFIYDTLLLKSLNKLFISWADPVYPYLFNGLNFASGKLVVGHIDHPGTPVQCFAAVIIRVIHLFRGEISLAKDVLSNPELYASCICHAIALLVCLTTFYVGYNIYKKSNQLWKGLFFQLTPIASLDVLHNTTILTTEPFLLIGILLLITLIFHYSYKEPSPQVDKKYAMGFALVCGFIMAVKISSLPLIVVPFLMLQGKRNKWIFAFLTFVSFFIFIAPALGEFKQFKAFLSDVLFHTGKYGKGPEGIITISSFKENVKLIFSKEYLFPITYGIIGFSLLISLYKKGFQLFKNDKRLRLLAGIFIAMSLQTLIVSKHYSSHYLIPVLCLIIPAVYFSLPDLEVWTSFKGHQKWNAWKAAGVIIVAIVFFSHSSLRTNFSEFQKNSNYSTADFLLFYPKTPRIIISTETSTPFIEPALYFGLIYSGKKRFSYVPLLNEIYPKCYFYSIPGNYFYSWPDAKGYMTRNIWDIGTEFLLSTILSFNPKLILFVRHNDNVDMNSILDDIKELNHNAGIVSMNKIFENNENHDIVYEINSDTAKMASIWQLQQNILCDNESLTPEGNLFKSTAQYNFSGVPFKSSERALSGKTSVKLSAKDQFALETTFKIQAGHTYQISVWKQSSDHDLALVVAAKDNSFYKSSKFSMGKNGAWEELKIAFKIPSYNTIDSLKVYVWNTENTTVYLDNFRIKELSYK
jgi:hypothetical protein